MSLVLEAPEATAAVDHAAVAARHRGIECAIALTEADNECEHGHLPHDPNPVCVCWTQARTLALANQRPLFQPDYEADKEDDSMSVLHTSQRQVDRQRRAQEMYSYYEADETRSLADVGEQFSLSGSAVGAEFKVFGYKARPRGYKAGDAKPTVPASLPHATVAPPAPDVPAEVKVETPVPNYQAKALELLDELEAEIAVLTRARDALLDLA